MLCPGGAVRAGQQKQSGDQLLGEFEFVNLQDDQENKVQQKTRRERDDQDVDENEEQEAKEGRHRRPSGTSVRQTTSTSTHGPF